MEENKGQVCQVCGAGANGRCGACGMGRSYFGHHILRWILGILIIVWVFSIGMKIGEWKSYVESGAPYYREFRTTMPMMYNSSYGEPTGGTVIFSQAAPAGTATGGTTIKK